MYIHHTLSLMNIKEHYTDNDKHVGQEHSYDKYKYIDLICIEKILF